MCLNNKQQYKNQTQIQQRLMNDYYEQKSTSPMPNHQQKSRFGIFIAALCRCFKTQEAVEASNPGNSNAHEETKTQMNSKTNIPDKSPADHRKDSFATIQALVIDPSKERNRKSSLFTSLHEITNKYQEDENVTKSTAKKWHNYPVYSYRQNQFLTLGVDNYKILAKIYTIRIQPSNISQNLTEKSKIYSKKGNSYLQSNLDRYWNKRYHLFEKFDEGVSISQDLWPVIIPEAVSQHIASKVKCQTVLNAFCGVGGDAFKLAMTCSKVIAADRQQNHLKCFCINSKIYSVQNVEMTPQCLQNLKNVQPQVVVISSYMKLQQECLNSNIVRPSDMVPNLRLVIRNTFKICTNLVLILPANLQINQLGQIIAEQAINQHIITETCCMRIQKIFYLSQLKYLAVYFGQYICNSITINDELAWVYAYLNDNNKKVFPHKKLIKKLRETHGMIKLLNIILQSNSLEYNSQIEKLYEYIRKHNILPQDKLSKIIQQEKTEQERQKSKKDQNDQKIRNQNEQKSQQVQIERTNSYFSSMASQIKRISTDQREQQHDPYKSLPMQRSSIPMRSMIRQMGQQYDGQKKQMEDSQKRQSQVVQFHPKN